MNRLEEIVNKISLINHSQVIMDAVDYQYLYKQAERVDGLEERNSFLERAHRTNINIAEHDLEERDRYKQALEEILELKYNVQPGDYVYEAESIIKNTLNQSK